MGEDASVATTNHHHYVRIGEENREGRERREHSKDYQCKCRGPADPCGHGWYPCPHEE